MEASEVIYYSAIWAIGTLAGCFRSARDGDYNGLWHLFLVGAVAGSLAFGIVSVGNFYASGRGVIGCGVAAIFGALGREVTDKLILDLVQEVVSALVQKSKQLIEFFIGSNDKNDK